MKTYQLKNEDVKRKWYLVDAKDQIIGRLATNIATILNGKNKVEYTPHIDAGDFVIVINADKIRVTGRKLDQKMYRWHSGYPGGLKSRTLRQMLSDKPERVIYKAVKGMLPKNRLAARRLKRLKIYKGEIHPHQAQKPEKIEF